MAPRQPAKEARSPLPTGQLNSQDWLKAPSGSLQLGEVDSLVNANLKKANVQPTALTTDEQFIRRATLDLTGRLPMPADVTEFLADRRPNKRALLIDALLETDDFARHWALYFRDVLVSRNSDPRAQLLVANFDKWMAGQLKTNKSWGQITRALLGATGTIRYDDPDKNGEAFFLASRIGPDATTEIAAETSRIFLGVQIQCAQCHDHPSDIWKRQQFHEFAAFFARLKQRPVRDGMRQAGMELISTSFGEHRMPDKEDPKKTTALTPKFIDGKSPKSARFTISDQERRQALAEFVTSKDNPWFAGAFINRLWGELMGQAFYQPVDDMGPQKDAVMPEVLARVAAAFRTSDYDIKGLFRAIMLSETYQRQIRPGESSDDHLLFAANNPTRMSANTLWQTLVGTLGAMGPFAGGPPMKKGPAAGGPFGRFQGLEGTFKQEFGHDPSAKSDEIEGSVSQVAPDDEQSHHQSKDPGEGDQLAGTDPGVVQRR